jgi:hypothetical protein
MADTQAQLILAIKAHIARGDKATQKGQDHYISAGQYLAQLKKAHVGTWTQWEELLKTKVGISTGRASELMQIGDGRKTVAQVRAGKAASVKQLRARASLRSEGQARKARKQRTTKVKPAAAPPDVDLFVSKLMKLDPDLARALFELLYKGRYPVAEDLALRLKDVLGLDTTALDTERAASAGRAAEAVTELFEDLFSRGRWKGAWQRARQ